MYGTPRGDAGHGPQHFGVARRVLADRRRVAVADRRHDRHAAVVLVVVLLLHPLRDPRLHRDRREEAQRERVAPRRQRTAAPPPPAARACDESRTCSPSVRAESSVRYRMYRPRGSGSLVPSSKFQVPSLKNRAPATRYDRPGAARTWNSGTWNLERMVLPLAHLHEVRRRRRNRPGRRHARAEGRAARRRRSARWTS